MTPAGQMDQHLCAQHRFIASRSADDANHRRQLSQPIRRHDARRWRWIRRLSARLLAHNTLMGGYHIGRRRCSRVGCNHDHFMMVLVLMPTRCCVYANYTAGYFIGALAHTCHTVEQRLLVVLGAENVEHGGAKVTVHFGRRPFAVDLLSGIPNKFVSIDMFSRFMNSVEPPHSQHTADCSGRSSRQRASHFWKSYLTPFWPATAQHDRASRRNRSVSAAPIVATISAPHRWWLGSVDVGKCQDPADEDNMSGCHEMFIRLPFPSTQQRHASIAGIRTRGTPWRPAPFWFPASAPRWRLSMTIAKSPAYLLGKRNQKLANMSGLIPSRTTTKCVPLPRAYCCSRSIMLMWATPLRSCISVSQWVTLPLPGPPSTNSTGTLGGSNFTLPPCGGCCSDKLALIGAFVPLRAGWPRPPTPFQLPPIVSSVASGAVALPFASAYGWIRIWYSLDTSNLNTSVKISRMIRIETGLTFNIAQGPVIDDEFSLWIRPH